MRPWHTSGNSYHSLYTLYTISNYKRFYYLFTLAGGCNEHTLHLFWPKPRNAFEQDGERHRRNGGRSSTRFYGSWGQDGWFSGLVIRHMIPGSVTKILKTWRHFITAALHITWIYSYPNSTQPFQPPLPLCVPFWDSFLYLSCHLSYRTIRLCVDNSTQRKRGPPWKSV